MSGQVSQYGAQSIVNLFAGNVPVAVQGSAPTPVPGLSWVDTSSSNAVKHYNGSAWVTGTSRYLMLLTAPPGTATTIAGLTEVTTSGYARQSVTFATATGAYPSVVSNSNLVTFGPFTADMLLPSQWAAMVDVSSGTTGQFLYSWNIASQQVSASQNIQISIGQLSLSES